MKNPLQQIRPADVSKDAWDDFVKLRSLKKAPITLNVINRFRVQAIIAKMTLEEVFDECVMRGWTGFKAEWVNADQQQTNSLRRVSAPADFSDDVPNYLDAP